MCTLCSQARHETRKFPKSPAMFVSTGDVDDVRTLFSEIIVIKPVIQCRVRASNIVWGDDKLSRPSMTSSPIKAYEYLQVIYIQVLNVNASLICSWREKDEKLASTSLHSLTTAPSVDEDVLPPSDYTHTWELTKHWLLIRQLDGRFQQFIFLEI